MVSFQRFFVGGVGWVGGPKRWPARWVVNKKISYFHPGSLGVSSSNLTTNKMFQMGWLKPPASLYVLYIFCGFLFFRGGCQDEGRWPTRFPSILSWILYLNWCWAEVMVGQWPLASQDLEFFVISDFRKNSAFLGHFWGDMLDVSLNRFPWHRAQQSLRFYHFFLVWISGEMANNLVGALFTSEWWCILTYCIKRRNINISFMSITFTYLKHGIAV